MIQDGKDQFITFLTDAYSELRSIYFTLVDAKLHGYKNLTPQQLYGLRNTIDGFYEPILDIIYKYLGSEEGVLIKNGVLYDLGMKLRDIRTNCDIAQSYLKEAITANVKESTHTYLFDEQEGRVSDLYTDE
jgi:hypothetical protein